MLSVLNRIDGRPTQTSLSLDEQAFNSQLENVTPASIEPVQGSDVVAATSVAPAEDASEPAASIYPPTTTGPSAESASCMSPTYFY